MLNTHIKEEKLKKRKATALGFEPYIISLVQFSNARIRTRTPKGLDRTYSSPDPNSGQEASIAASPLAGLLGTARVTPQKASTQIRGCKSMMTMRWMSRSMTLESGDSTGGALGLMILSRQEA